VACHFWSNGVNAFLFGHGPMSPTLADVYMITSLDITGSVRPWDLRRRKTTSLMKFHPLTLHTSLDSWELTKHCTCEATIVKNPYTEIKEEKAGLIYVESFL
jgi:hypothetical protein